MRTGEQVSNFILWIVSNLTFSLGPMLVDEEILKTYGPKIDILAFCNSFLYFNEVFSYLSNYSDPRFTEKDSSYHDSFTILVNRYIPKTY